MRMVTSRQQKKEKKKKVIQSVWRQQTINFLPTFRSSSPSLLGPAPLSASPLSVSYDFCVFPLDGGHILALRPVENRLGAGLILTTKSDPLPIRTANFIIWIRKDDRSPVHQTSDILVLLRHIWRHRIVSSHQPNTVHVCISDSTCHIYRHSIT